MPLSSELDSLTGPRSHFVRVFASTLSCSEQGQSHNRGEPVKIRSIPRHVRTRALLILCPRLGRIPIAANRGTQQDPFPQKQRSTALMLTDRTRDVSPAHMGSPAELASPKALGLAPRVRIAETFGSMYMDVALPGVADWAAQVQSITCR